MPRFLKNKWLWIGLVLIVVLVVGFLFMQQSAAAKKAEQEKAAAEKIESPYAAIANGKADVEGGIIQIAARRGMRGVESGKAPRVVEGEAVVMPGGQRDVTRPGLPGETRQSAGVEFLGGEFFCQLLVLLQGNLAEMLNPFALAEERIQSPVHKNAESQTFKTGDAGQGLGDG